MRFFNHRGAFFEDEWLSVVDRGLFRLVQLWNRRSAACDNRMNLVRLQFQTCQERIGATNRTRCPSHSSTPGLCGSYESLHSPRSCVRLPKTSENADSRQSAA